MKIINILSVLAASMILLAACGKADQPARSGPAPEQEFRPAVKAAATAKSPGNVTIRFDYQRIRQRASDQLAVWVEDAQGKHVRTLLVTKFTANDGYQKRAEAVPEWQKAFQPASASRSALDAISSATPQSGPLAIVWDCLDQSGRAVPAGSYVYKVEANIKWEQTAFWQGSITVGPAAGQSAAAAAAGGDNALLRAVRADFVPAT